ncbi:MAG TPA: glycosyltransferase, partial [Armatimonadota bacterium]|nr:glycosyltransferase [Armatimonadota bacterium]
MLGRNRGKGAALNKALSQANGEVLLLLDADLGKSASEAVNLLEPVLSGEADMTIAVFKPTDADGKLSSRSGGFGLAMKTARLGIRLLGGKWVQSPLSGQRAFKREIVEKRGFALRFGVETGLTIDALRGGYRVVEVPVRMVHRPSGRSLRGFVHRGRQMADVLLTLGRKALGR